MNSCFCMDALIVLVIFLVPVVIKSERTTQHEILQGLEDLQRIHHRFKTVLDDNTNRLSWVDKTLLQRACHGLDAGTRVLYQVISKKKKKAESSPTSPQSSIMEVEIYPDQKIPSSGASKTPVKDTSGGFKTPVKGTSGGSKTPVKDTTDGEFKAQKTAKEEWKMSKEADQVETSGEQKRFTSSSCHDESDATDFIRKIKMQRNKLLNIALEVADEIEGDKEELLQGPEESVPDAVDSLHEGSAMTGASDNNVRDLLLNVRDLLLNVRDLLLKTENLLTAYETLLNDVLQGRGAADDEGDVQLVEAFIQEIKEAKSKFSSAISSLIKEGGLERELESTLRKNSEKADKGSECQCQSQVAGEEWNSLPSDISDELLKKLYQEVKEMNLRKRQQQYDSTHSTRKTPEELKSKGNEVTVLLKLGQREGLPGEGDNIVELSEAVDLNERDKSKQRRVEEVNETAGGEKENEKVLVRIQQQVQKREQRSHEREATQVQHHQPSCKVAVVLERKRKLGQRNEDERVRSELLSKTQEMKSKFYEKARQLEEEVKEKSLVQQWLDQTHHMLQLYNDLDSKAKEALKRYFKSSDVQGSSRSDVRQDNQEFNLGIVQKFANDIRSHKNQLLSAARRISEDIMAHNPRREDEVFSDDNQTKNPLRTRLQQINDSSNSIVDVVLDKAHTLEGSPHLYQQLSRVIRCELDLLKSVERGLASEVPQLEPDILRKISNLRAEKEFETQQHIAVGAFDSTAWISRLLVATLISSIAVIVLMITGVLSKGPNVRHDL